MMDTHTPRIVGTFADDDVNTGVDSSVPEERPARALRPPLRVQRVFTEADSSYESVAQPSPQNGARRGSIKQLPLRHPERPPVARDPASNDADRPTLPPAGAPPAPLSTVELTRHIQKLSKDLLLGSAVVTVNVAELAAHIFSLVGLVALIFPGQFLHTCLLTLYWRVSGRESNYGVAFARCWNTYRQILQTRWQTGPFEVSLSFVVGFALLSPFLALKVLELANAFVRVAK